MTAYTPAVEILLDTVPNIHRGPGGVALVVQDGQVLGQKAWGYADTERHIEMTDRTVFPICSITKQMVCLVVESLRQKPTVVISQQGGTLDELLETEILRLLPHLPRDHDLKAPDLENMQSGLPDYWAMTTLWGARPDGRFSLMEDAPRALDRIRSFQFAPGTDYSYSNINYHVLARALENVSGLTFAQLLATRIFAPARMDTASLCPDTSAQPSSVVGYEGNDTMGWFPATNRIEWIGDGGICASAADMAAYEAFVSSSDLYAEISRRQTFRDGKPAVYGRGLIHSEIAGMTALRHGGALAGFRHERLHIPSERLSVVVFLNHEASPAAITEYIVKRLLSYTDPHVAVLPVASAWNGDFLDNDTLLHVTVSANDGAGEIIIDYGPGLYSETARVVSRFSARTSDMNIALIGDMLCMERAIDHRTIRATRLSSYRDGSSLIQGARSDLTGTYHSNLSDSVLEITGRNGALYGSFHGFMGRTPFMLIHQLGPDVCRLRNARSLDSPAPGNWTMVFRRSEKNAGEVGSCIVGCSLVWQVEYVKS